MDKLKGYKNSQMTSLQMRSLENIFDTVKEIVVCREEKIITQREVRFPCNDADIMTDIKFQTKNVKRVYFSIKNDPYRSNDYEFDTKLNFPIPIISIPFSNSWLKIVPEDENLPFECIVRSNKHHILDLESRRFIGGGVTYQKKEIARNGVFTGIKHATRHVKYWMLQKKLDGIKSDIKERKLLDLIISYANPVQLAPKASFSIVNYFIPLSVKLKEKEVNTPEIIKNIWDFYDNKKDDQMRFYQEFFSSAVAVLDLSLD